MEDERTILTIERFLNGLEPGGLFDLEDALDELRASKGWRELDHLMAVHADSVAAREGRMAVGSLPDSLDALIASSSRQAVSYGTVRGIRQTAIIMDQVKAKANHVRAAIERATEGEK